MWGNRLILINCNYFCCPSVYNKSRVRLLGDYCDKGYELYLSYSFGYWTFSFLHCSQRLYLYLNFIFLVWRAIACHTDTFSSTEHDKKTTQKENYKMKIRQTKLSLSKTLQHPEDPLLLLAELWSPPWLPCTKQSARDSQALTRPECICNGCLMSCLLVSCFFVWSSGARTPPGCLMFFASHLGL